jgi:hypothetical protein
MLRGQQEELEHKEMREVLLQEEEEVEEVEEECMQRAAQAIKVEAKRTSTCTPPEMMPSTCSQHKSVGG